MKYDVRSIHQSEFGIWNEAVLSCPNATLFHTTDWLSAGGVSFEILGVFEEARLIGGFVSQYAHEGNARTSERSFLTPYSGQVVFEHPNKRSSEVTIQKAVAGLTAEYLKANYSRINVRLSPFVTDIQPYIWAGFQASVRYTYLVDISCMESAWANLDENHRRSIRSVKKAGASIESDFDVLDGISMYRATRETPQSRAKRISEYNQSLTGRRQCKAFGIRSPEGGMLAAIYIVWDRFRTYYLLGGYREDGDAGSVARAATTFGIWETMRFSSVDLGLREFDLEGSMIPGVELFFRKFGGRLTPFYTIAWNRNAERGSGVMHRIKRAVKRSVTKRM